MPSKSPRCEEDEDESGASFDKFVEMSDALEKQSSVIQSESVKFLQSHTCPFINEKCRQMDCCYYIICLNKNTRAFKEFFQ